MMIISSTAIVTLDKANPLLRNGAIVVHGDRIADLGDSALMQKKYKDEMAINIGGKVVLPGLIDSHTHMCRSLLRGQTTNIPLGRLLQYFHNYRANVSKEEVRIAALLSCVEMIRSGTTCVVSHQNARFIEEAIEATVRVGLRGIFARILVDDPRVPDNLRETPFQAIRNTLELHERYRSESKANVMFGPMGLHNCSFELMREVAEANQDHNLGIHTHCSETRKRTERIKRSYGASEIEVLQKAGVLTRRTMLIHCNYISDDDIHMIRGADSSIVHCPSSSTAKRSLHSLPSNFIGSTVTVALGSDGPNACHNLFIELERCALLDRSLSMMDRLQMVTINAAKSLGMEEEIGSLKSGKKADLVIIEPHDGKDSPSVLNSMEGSHVTDVMIDGRFVMRNGNILTCDEQQVMCGASSYVKARLVELCRKNEHILRCMDSNYSWNHCGCCHRVLL